MLANPRAATADWFAWIIGPLVFLSRWLTMSRPYFVDGPHLIQAALNHTFVIQPPGYWLWVRLAGLFHDPAAALGLGNALASGLGAIVFYRLCLLLTSPAVARLSALAYASVFFAWFAGSIHSSYAPELLFPPLMLLFMLEYTASARARFCLGASTAYALAAGFRPPDGAFLAPVFLYFNLYLVKNRRHRVLALALALLLCSCWYVPQRLALARSGSDSATQLWSVARNEAPILHGFSKLAVSNMVRVFFPLLLAFWSLLPLVPRSIKPPLGPLLALWLAPGLAFFTLVYISEAPYLCFLLPAILLLFVACRDDAPMRRALLCCVAFNVLFFSLARPIDRTRNLLVAIYSVSGAKYSLWALKHEWFRTLDSYTDVPVVRSKPRTHEYR